MSKKFQNVWLYFFKKNLFTFYYQDKHCDYSISNEGEMWEKINIFLNISYCKAIIASFFQSILKFASYKTGNWNQIQ